MSKRKLPPQPTTFYMALAYCAMSRALRPFIANKHAGFLGILVVQDHLLASFKTVGQLLFNEHARVHGGIDKKTSITVIKGDKKGDWLFETAHGDHRLVLIASNESDVPYELRDAADIYSVPIVLEPRLLKGAIYRLCKTLISNQDASYLLDQPMERLAVAFRHGRSARRAIALLKRAPPQVPIPLPRAGGGLKQSPRLEDLDGYGDARDWGLRVAKDVAAYREGNLSWEDIDSGVLLSGPTGCGKTRFAQILAEHCGIPFHQGSAAYWQSHGHMGDMLHAMRRSFEAATADAPCVLLIDELDSFGDRAARDSNNSEYVREVINGALELLDGAKKREGVIVIATTNYAGRIDRAFTRPGRLGRHIAISLPDPSARVAILQRHLGFKIGVDVIEHLILSTDDWSGADLEQLAKDARRRARESDRGPVSDDIIACLPELVALTEGQLAVNAIHECGHAMVGLAVGRPIAEIKLADRRPKDGGRYSVGKVAFQHSGDFRRTAAFYLDEIRILLGGIAGEQEMFGDHDDGAAGNAESDLAKATRLAVLAEGVYGFGDSLVSEHLSNADDLSLLFLRNPGLRSKVNEVLREQLRLARSLIHESRDVLQALASHLIDHKSMTGQEVADFLAEHGFQSMVGEPIQRPQTPGWEMGQ